MERLTECRNGHPGSDSVMGKDGTWNCLACQRSYDKAKYEAFKLRKDYDPYKVDTEMDSIARADEFADRLREARKAQGTQADVAMAAGVNAWTLQHRERNLKRNLRIISAYAESIGVRVEFLMKLPVDTDD